MDDRRIVDLAMEAGMCFPRCWYLDQLDVTEEPDPEALLKMRQLRTFAELITAEVLSDIADAMEDPLGFGGTD